MCQRRQCCRQFFTFSKASHFDFVRYFCRSTTIEKSLKTKVKITLGRSAFASLGRTRGQELHDKGRFDLGLVRSFSRLSTLSFHRYSLFPPPPDLLAPYNPDIPPYTGLHTPCLCSWLTSNSLIPFVLSVGCSEEFHRAVRSLQSK